MACAGRQAVVIRKLAPDGSVIGWRVLVRHTAPSLIELIPRCGNAAGSLNERAALTEEAFRQLELSTLTGRAHDPSSRPPVRIGVSLCLAR